MDFVKNQMWLCFIYPWYPNDLNIGSVSPGDSKNIGNGIWKNLKGHQYQREGRQILEQSASKSEIAHRKKHWSYQRL